MFLFMGFIAANTGLAAGAFDLCVLLARCSRSARRVGACGWAASGSSIATTGMSKIAVPEMLKAKYHPSLATGVVAASGTLGSLIPPSILMVLYGIFTEQSIGQLVIAGVIPGVLSAFVYMAMITVRATVTPQLAPPVVERIDRAQILGLLWSVWPFPVLVLGVLGGISAVSSPTEAGAVGAFLAATVACCAARRPAALAEAIRQTTLATSSIFFSIGAVMFTRFMGLSACTRPDGYDAVGVGQSDRDHPDDRRAFRHLGDGDRPIGLILLTLPILLPVLEAADINLIWFGIICIKLLEIGLVTPPVGLNLCPAQRLGR